MTDPVILLGTQSNGETLPVQVDGFGRLVAEGLQGSEGPEGPAGEEGPQGPQGPQGPPGPGIELPPDPYEGALLGWLNNELAWVGSPPVPIPEDAFGPIQAWNPDGLLISQNPIPEVIANGVYIYQCDEAGNASMPAAFNQTMFSSLVTPPPRSQDPAANLFDGTYDGPGCIPKYPGDGGTGKASLVLTDWPTGFVRLNGVKGGSGGGGVKINGRPVDLDQDVQFSDGSLLIEWFSADGFNYTRLDAITINNRLLVDSNVKLTARVNQRLDDYQLIVVPTVDVSFTPGQYLRPEPQRVAPWVLYGNDPTSLIDHLRSS